MAERDSQRRWRGKKGSKVNTAEYVRHVGTIKNYSHDKGFGFIDCPDVEKDIYVNQRHINGFRIGDRVCFTVAEDDQGVKAIGLEHAPHHREQDHVPARRSDGRQDSSWSNGRRETAEDFSSDPLGFGQASSAASTASTSLPSKTGKSRGKHSKESYEGVINYINDKGHGYITCHELSTQDDVFCDRRQLRGFNVGDRVQFHWQEAWHEPVDLRHAPVVQVEDVIRDDILNKLWQNIVEPADSSSGTGNRDQAGSMNSAQSNGTGYDQSQFNDEPLYQGVIKMFDEAKGYGFIMCPAKGGDFYVPKVHLKGMKVGQCVNFAIREYKGKPQAYNLSICEDEVDGAALIMDGLSAAQSSPSNQRRDPYHGVVKTFDQEKGYGFISCREIQDIYSVDVFVHQKGLKKGLADLSPGDHVSFFIRLDDKNRPQAMKVSHCDPPSDGGEADPFSGPVAKISYSGSIKSFVSSNDNEGYGFISCPDVLEKYKRDAFVHMKQIKDFKVGDAVTFSVRENNLGHPQAYDLREAPKSVAWLSVADSPEEPAEKEEAFADKEYFGKIKSFNEKQGYGFIDCEELHKQYERDVFIPQVQFQGLGVGDQVSFRIQVKRGQPQAHEVVCVLSRTLSAAQSELQRLDGKTLDKKLLRACASARVESVEEVHNLLEASANPNSRDVTGQTPVMMAALNIRHSERKCRLLIKANADIDGLSSKNADSLTVLQWARERINPSFAAFLQACAKGDAPDCEIELAKPPGDEF